MHEESNKHKVTWRNDLSNIFLLLFLYTLQGIPIGLSETMDLILQEMEISFEKQGIFGFVTLPFSLKLLWAPLVDALYFPTFGRRKTWLVPVQLFIGFLLIYTSTTLSSLLNLSANSNQETLDIHHNTVAEPRIYSLTAIFFLLYFLAATQDIAVDGWALSLLQQENVGYASTCNSIGQNIGYICAYSGFLALKSYGVLNLEQFLEYSGYLFILSTVLLSLLKREKHLPAESHAEALTVYETYQVTLKILKLPMVQTLIFLVFLMKSSFAFFDTLFLRKLIKKGLKKEHVANLSLCSIPLSFIIPGLISPFASKTPLGIVSRSVPFRLILCFFGTLLVMFSPELDEDSSVSSQPLFFISLLIISLSLTVVQTVMFVSLLSFYSKISDEKIGGSYMTLLATFHNLCGILPSQVSLFIVDEVSVLGVDGFYVLSVFSLCIGTLWHFKYSEKFVNLEKLSSQNWAVLYRNKSKAI